jgi:zona occludens toxin
MPIKIHHGAPGSYKTSGAVHDDFIPAVLAGRYIITNIRGLNDEHLIRQVLTARGKIVPDSFKILNLDIDDTEQLNQLRHFWHWSPDGVYFFLDEVQIIYPKEWRAIHFKKMDYPASESDAAAEGRFVTIQQAFQQHRHRNWDFCLMTPNISLVNPMIRACAEGAFKHKNMAMIGLFKGSYLESFHASETAGKSKSDIYASKRKRVPSYVFDLYQSTITGLVSDTKAGASIFSDPKILLLLAVAVFFTVYGLSGLPSIFKFFNPEKDSPATSAVSVEVPKNIPQTNVKVFAPNNNNVNYNLGNSASAKSPAYLELFQKAKIIYLDSYIEFYEHRVFKITVELDNKKLRLDEKAIKRMNLTFNYYSACFSELRYKDQVFYVYCPDDQPKIEKIDAPAALAAIAREPAAADRSQ